MSAPRPPPTPPQENTIIEINNNNTNLADAKPMQLLIDEENDATHTLLKYAAEVEKETKRLLEEKTSADIECRWVRALREELVRETGELNRMTEELINREMEELNSQMEELNRENERLMGENERLQREMAFRRIRGIGCVGIWRM